MGHFLLPDIYTLARLTQGGGLGRESPCPLAAVATHKAAGTLLLCVPEPGTQEPSHRIRNLRADWCSIIYEEDVRLELHGLEVWHEEEHVSHPSFHLICKLWKRFSYVRPV
jgi:hypothetical protein